MHAAVVSDFAIPPRWQEFGDPVAGPGQTVVEVLAAGLHPRVRSQADGSHYTSTDELPLVPGIDGVGRRADGVSVYFVQPDTRFGSMAERVAIDNRRSVELPGDSDPIRLAAAMNPAMSAWIALRRRIEFTAGAQVLVLGATGNAGRMAVQVARRLGASRVVAAGRTPAKLARLARLGADTLVDLDAPGADGDLAAAATDVAVVIDYLWGVRTSTAMQAIIPARRDDSQPLTWIQVGSVTGGDAAIPAAALRAARLSIVGSGQGSVSPRDIVAELSNLVTEIGAGTFEIDARAYPMTQVRHAWGASTTDSDRVVLVP